MPISNLKLPGHCHLGFFIYHTTAYKISLEIKGLFFLLYISHGTTGEFCKLKIHPYGLLSTPLLFLITFTDNCYLLFQIYTGIYVLPINNPVEQVESFLEGLQVETHVAVFLSNCAEEPVIGIVKEVTEDHFKIHYWKGTYRGKWSPLSLPRTREPWMEVLPRECIILHSSELTEAKRLQLTTRRHLMAKYTSLRNAANNSQSSAAVHV